MNVSTPQATLPLDLCGKETTGRKTTPGDVGDSLFHRLLQKANSGDDDESLGALAWIPALLQDRTSGSGDAASGTSGQAGIGENITGLSLNQVTVPSTAVARLSGMLEHMGFSSRQIDTLLLSLAEKDGSIRLGRLLAKLQGMMPGRGDEASSLMVNPSDIPRVEEALFKMGLNVNQVRDATAKALDSKGNLDLGRLTSALSQWFSGVDGEAEKHLAAVLRHMMDIELRAASMEQVIKDAGLDQALQRLKGDASDGAREAMKQEIALLLQQKGIAADDVKRFLETLSIRQAETTVRAGNQQALLQGDSALQVAVGKDGPPWQQEGWQERILDILNRQDPQTGRGDQGAFGKEGTMVGLNPADGLAKAVAGHSGAGTGGTKGDASLLNGGRWSDVADAIMGGASADTGKTALPRESVPAGSATDSSGGRNVFPVDFSEFRVDRSASAGTTAPANPSTQAASLPDPLTRIVDRMTWMIQSGQQTSRIQISPPELGRLDLEIVIKHGHMQAHINAENPAVKELIEANLPQLKQQLSHLGFVVERFEVAAGLDERRFAEQQEWTGGRGGRRRRNQTVPGATPEPGPVQVPGSTHGHYSVDVHV